MNEISDSVPLWRPWTVIRGALYRWIHFESGGFVYWEPPIPPKQQRQQSCCRCCWCSWEWARSKRSLANKAARRAFLLLLSTAAPGCLIGAPACGGGVRLSSTLWWVSRKRPGPRWIQNKVFITEIPKFLTNLIPGLLTRDTRTKVKYNFLIMTWFKKINFLRRCFSTQLLF